MLTDSLIVVEVLESRRDRWLFSPNLEKEASMHVPFGSSKEEPLCESTASERSLQGVFAFIEESKKIEKSLFNVGPYFATKYNLKGGQYKIQPESEEISGLLAEEISDLTTFYLKIGSNTDKPAVTAVASSLPKIQKDILRQREKNKQMREFLASSKPKPIVPTKEIELKCGYCKKIVEDMVTFCSKCSLAVYCNDKCKLKDTRFHSKKCV